MSTLLTAIIRSPTLNRCDEAAGEFPVIFEMKTPGQLGLPNGCEHWSIPPTIDKPNCEALEKRTIGTSFHKISSKIWMIKND